MCWVSSSKTLSADCGLNCSEPSNFEYSNWAISVGLRVGCGRVCYCCRFAAADQCWFFGAGFVRFEFPKDCRDQLRQTLPGDGRDPLDGRPEFLVEQLADFVR